MIIKIDVGKCIAAGQCVRAADDIFAQDEDTGIVILKVRDLAVHQEAAAKTAARRCPVRAIEIED